MYTQDFFLNGKPAGSSQRGKWRVQAIYRAPPSSIFFCRECGDIFAKVIVRDEAGIVQHWEALSLLCERCSNPALFAIPGSIIKIWDSAYIEALPESLLLREFHLLLKHKTGRGLWT